MVFKQAGEPTPFFENTSMAAIQLSFAFFAFGIPGLHPSGCSSHLESMPHSRICFHLLSWSREGAVFFAMQLVLASRSQTSSKHHVAVPTPKFRQYTTHCLGSTRILKPQRWQWKISQHEGIIQIHLYIYFQISWYLFPEKNAVMFMLLKALFEGMQHQGAECWTLFIG